MIELLKKLFSKDYIKASELYDSKDIKANFKLVLYIKFVRIFLYFMYSCFTILVIWSLGFLFGYSNAVPSSITFTFFILFFIALYLNHIVRKMKFKNPTKNEKKYFEENPRFEQFMRKKLNIKE